MTFYIIWAILLVLQNAAFTWVSRARNSGSDWYHAIAAVFSNGIWLVATFFTFDKVFYTAITEGFTLEVAAASLLYVAMTVSGSVFMGKFLRRFVERGKRQVGHYDDKAARIDQLEQDVRSMARVLDAHISTGRQAEAKERIKARLMEMRGESVGEEMDDTIVEVTSGDPVAIAYPDGAKLPPDFEPLLLEEQGEETDD